MQLTNDNVENVFLDCLYREDEMLGVPEGQPPEGAVLIQGIGVNAGLHPERLNGHLEDIRTMLVELPEQFRHDKRRWMVVPCSLQQQGRCSVDRLPQDNGYSVHSRYGFESRSSMRSSRDVEHPSRRNALLRH